MLCLLPYVLFSPSHHFCSIWSTTNRVGAGNVFICSCFVYFYYSTLSLFVRTKPQSMAESFQQKWSYIYLGEQSSDHYNFQFHRSVAWSISYSTGLGKTVAGVAHLLYTRSDLWLRGWPGYLATLDLLEQKAAYIQEQLRGERREVISLCRFHKGCAEVTWSKPGSPFTALLFSKCHFNMM